MISSVPMGKGEKMDDSISRQAAIQAIAVKPAIHGSEGSWYHWDDIKNALEELPAIEAVKHGKWVKDGETYALYKCSACNDFCTVAGWANCIPEKQMYKAFKFCPNCGAKMDGREDE